MVVRKKDSSEAQVIWSLPFWEEGDSGIWVEGQVVARVPEDPNYLWRVRSLNRLLLQLALNQLS